MGETIFVGGGGENYGTAQNLLLKYANRHGLIAGATGTGKTVTLQILAESFSAQGVPVFLADVKGDLSGLAVSGTPEHKLHDAFMKRATTIKFDDFDYDKFPVVFWDMFGEKGHAASMLFHLFSVGWHDHLHEVLGVLVARFTFNDDLSDIAIVKVANGPVNQVAFLINRSWRDRL